MGKIPEFNLKKLAGRLGSLAGLGLSYPTASRGVVEVGGKSLCVSLGDGMTKGTVIIYQLGDFWGDHEFKLGPVGGVKIFRPLLGVTKSTIRFFWRIGGNKLFFCKMMLAGRPLYIHVHVLYLWLPLHLFFFICCNYHLLYYS